MPKPSTKRALLKASQENYTKFQQFITTLNEEQRTMVFPEGTLNRNLRDVVGHLHHWHVMMIDWYTQGMKGIQPAMPAKGYTWKMTPALNRNIWEACQATSYETMHVQLEKSYAKVQSIIQSHTDEELFEKRRYPWTGSTSLGAYLILNSSSHYHWALQFIKKQYR